MIEKKLINPDEEIHVTFATRTEIFKGKLKRMGKISGTIKGVPQEFQSLTGWCNAAYRTLVDDPPGFRAFAQTMHTAQKKNVTCNSNGMGSKKPATKQKTIE